MSNLTSARKLTPTAAAALPINGRHDYPVTIGLLGGSFNPAHDGHVHIALEALKRLNLDQVWWLVTPQNPLKSKKGMAPFHERLKRAQKLTQRHRQIRVMDIEARLKTRYTLETVRALKKMNRRTRFVWLMGSDQLATFDRWYDWRTLFQRIPVVIFPRPGSLMTVRSSKCGVFFKNWRVFNTNRLKLKLQSPPIWVYLKMPMRLVSSTAIRKRHVGAWWRRFF